MLVIHISVVLSQALQPHKAHSDMHGPTRHNERTSLLRNKRGGENNGQPSQLPPWVIPPKRDSEDLERDLTYADFLRVLLALLVLIALACGALFILWLAATGIFYAISHIHWPHIGWPHRSVQPEIEPPYVWKVAIIGIEQILPTYHLGEFIF